jgi:hypothetical protein
LPRLRSAPAIVRRLCLSLFTLVILASLAHGDSFGRFGYGPVQGLTDLKVSLSGFHADSPKASEIAFSTPALRFDPISTRATAQVCAVTGDSSCPQKIRTSLIGNSVDLYFKNGLTLICRSNDPPFLSWNERSVGPGVPTEDVSWLLLSFSSAEPPYVFGFCGKTASLTVKGSPNNWRISDPDFVGWMRVWLPLGLDPQFGTDVVGLSKLTKEVEPFSDAWAADTPSVVKVDVVATDLAVDATWTFSGPGAFVPEAALLAPLGGSLLKIISNYQSLPGDGAEGPLAITLSNKLGIHFPCRRLKPGRALGVGPSLVPKVIGESPSNLAAIVALGDQTLLAISNENALKIADGCVTRFLTDADYVLEPNTGQQLPYGQTGDGILLAAGQAYLAQCGLVSVDSTQPNALFQSLVWKRDWWSWYISTGNLKSSREATSLAALAGAMSSNKNDRFYGATLEAGLDAEQGRLKWLRRKNGRTDSTKLLEPMLDLRVGFFALDRSKEANLDFYHLLQSPIKIGIGSAVSVIQDANDYFLQWKCDQAKESSLTILQPPPGLEVTPVANFTKFTVTKEVQNLLLRFTPALLGICRVKMKTAIPSEAIPKEVIAPLW